MNYLIDAAPVVGVMAATMAVLMAPVAVDELIRRRRRRAR